MKRRSFLKKSALMTGALMVPGLYGASEQLQRERYSHRKLVLIQLSGGNDGLNTVVPFQNDLYYKARPFLGQRVSSLLPLNDELGFNGTLKGFKHYYDRGELLVINNVGSANQSQSHLEASNLWKFDGVGLPFNLLKEAQLSPLYMKSNNTYPDTLFGTQLRAIGQAISTEQLPMIYHATLGGFDTHTNQLGVHSSLLKILDEGITALVRDLKNSKKFRDTVVMVYSEFGRSVQENKYKGTDHGTSNNVFLFGENLKKVGVFNSAPNLANLDIHGQLKYQIDGSDLQAALLHNWFNLPVINDSFDNGDLLQII